MRQSELKSNRALINFGGSRREGGTMFVDPDLLHSGANESHRAGGHARDGADQLSRGPLLFGMFGGFAAAEAFHDEVSAAHAQHIKNLQGHQQTLTEVSRKGHYAANGFVDMDDRNAAEMRAVRCSSSPSVLRT
jgi:Protein of unknown function (DUF2563)